MKAIVQDKHGSPDVLELKEIDKPVVTDHEVLVRVRAATARWASDIPAGLRYIGRIAARLRKPSNDVPGLEMAGQVEAVGKNVKQFQPGDEVFGWCKGALAEYVSVSEDQLAVKPANLTFEEAAVVPISGFTALQGLRDKGQIEPGQKILIVGASGSVRYVRRADRQGVWSGSDRRVQHAKPGPRPIDRRRPRHRLHPRRLHRQWTAL
jgi:NADPH:quinone reductase-like Zn-dependent oxidoreductase